jgi:hypothetical protein
MFVWIRDYRSGHIIKNIVVYGFVNYRSAYNFILLLCCKLANVPTTTNLFTAEGKEVVEQCALGSVGGIGSLALSNQEIEQRIDKELTIAYFHRVQILIVKKMPSLEPCENETLAILIPSEKINDFL